MSSVGIHSQVERRFASGVIQMLNRSNVVAKGDFDEYATGSYALAGSSRKFK